MTFSGARKFKAKWTKSVDDSNHPSGAEAKWWDRMLLKQRAGLVFRLIGKPSFPVYIARDCPHCRDHGELIGRVELDGEFDDADGVHHYVDYKGREGETPISKFKRRFVEARFGINVELEGDGAKRSAKKPARSKKNSAPQLLRLGDDRKAG